MTALHDAVEDSLGRSLESRSDDAAIERIVASQDGLIAELHTVRRAVFDGE